MLFHNLWRGSVLSSFLIALFFLWFIFSDFSVIKNLIDKLSPDGQLESFDLNLFARLFWIFGVIGLLMLGWGLLGIYKKNLSKNIFINTIRLAGKLIPDFKVFFSDLLKVFPKGNYLIVMVSFVLMAGVLRGMILSRPMTHDETYTYLAFASQGFKTAISDYHLPNNHIFHTLLVLIFTNLLGNAPWVIRLPVFVTGIFMIPAIYLGVKTFFKNEHVALLASGLAVFHPELIRVSSEARGYPIVMLLTLILWGLSAYLNKNNNLFGWVLFVIVSTLGFYTVPTMLYSYGVFLVWLFFLWVKNDFGDGYSKLSFLIYLVMSGIGVVLLTNIFYSPVYSKIGFEQFLGNMVMGEMEKKPFGLYIEQFFSRISSTNARWNRDVFPGITEILWIGVAVSIIFSKNRRHKFSFIGAGILWIVGILTIQRNVPWARVWLFLLPFFLAYSSYGLKSIVNKLIDSTRTKNMVYFGTILLLGVSTLSWLLADNYMMLTWRGEPGDVEQSIEFVSDVILEQDVIVVTSPDGPAARYYSLLNNLPLDHFALNKESFNFAYVIVNDQHKQTVEYVINKRGVIEDEVDISTSELIYENTSIKVFVLDSK